VSSVFSRTGAVVATSGDYTGSQVTNTPNGTISSTTVQNALNELDTDKQPADADLTAISGLTPVADNLLQYKSGAWTNRTPSQLKTDLALIKADVNLANADNTSDVNKPVSTAQQTALDGKVNLNSANTYGDGFLQTFNPDNTNPGLVVGSNSSRPSSPVEGAVFFNTTTKDLEVYIDGVWTGVTRGEDITESTAARTITDADRNKTIICTNSSAITITLNSTPEVNTGVFIWKAAGSGDITLSTTGTLDAVDDQLLTNQSGAWVQHTGGGNWRAIGNLGIGGGGGGGSGTVTSVDVSGGTTGLSFSGGPVTSTGTITAGGILIGANGGTGVVNTGKTITVSGNTTIGSSTHTVAFATSANTSVTLPSSGTLATLAGSESLTNKKLGSLTSNGLVKTSGGDGTLSIATSGTDYEVPITFGTGLTRSTNTVTVNTSQNIATLSNLTSNGLVTTSGGTGGLSITIPGSNILTWLTTPSWTNFSSAITGTSPYVATSGSTTITTPTWVGNPFIQGNLLIGASGATITSNTPFDLRGISGGNIFRFADNSNALKMILTNAGKLTATLADVGNNAGPATVNVTATATANNDNMYGVIIDATQVTGGFTGTSMAPLDIRSGGTMTHRYWNTGEFDIGTNVRIGPNTGAAFSATGSRLAFVFSQTPSTTEYFHFNGNTNVNNSRTADFNGFNIVPPIVNHTSGTANYNYNLVNIGQTVTNLNGGTVNMTALNFDPTLTVNPTNLYGIRIRPAIALNGFGVTTPTAMLHIGAGTSTRAQFKRDATTLLTTAVAGVDEYSASGFYQTKASGLRYGNGGTVFDHYTDANNTGTSETDLYSYTTPASTLANDGEKIRATYAGQFNDATATSQLQVYFAGTVIYNSGALALSTTGSWEVNVLIIRTGSSTALATVTLQTATSSSVPYSIQTDLTGITFTNTNIIKVTGTAGGVGGGSNDITAKLGAGFWYAAANN
jgi:hypothetical protein